MQLDGNDLSESRISCAFRSELCVLPCAWELFRGSSYCFAEAQSQHCQFSAACHAWLTSVFHLILLQVLQAEAFFFQWEKLLA